MVSRIFSKVSEYRVRYNLNIQQPREQASFRKGFSTLYHMQIIRQIVDCTKAFDTINYKLFLADLYCSTTLIYCNVSNFFFALKQNKKHYQWTFYLRPPIRFINFRLGFRRFFCLNITVTSTFN